MRPPFSSDVVVCFFYSIQILFFHTLWLDDLYLSAVIEHPRKERWANSDFCGHHKGFIVEQVCFHVFTETVYNRLHEAVIAFQLDDAPSTVVHHEDLFAVFLLFFYLNLQKITLTLHALIAPRKETQIHIEVRQI